MCLSSGSPGFPVVAEPSRGARADWGGGESYGGELGSAVWGHGRSPVFLGARDCGADVGAMASRGDGGLVDLLTFGAFVGDGVDVRVRMSAVRWRWPAAGGVACLARGVLGREWQPCVERRAC